MSWLRLEGAARDPELGEGLAARIADPLWALARQWQVGEFHGEDAASPIVVEAEVSHARLAAFAPADDDGDGDGDGDSVLGRADADRPLEVLVEQEPADDDLRLALELGWLLLRALARAGAPRALLDGLRARYGVELSADDGLDPTGRVQLETLARRSLDGRRLAAELSAEPGAGAALLDALGVPANGRQRLGRAVRGWLAEVADFLRLPEVGACWRPEDLEYRFRVAAPLADGELALEASEYRGGTLDWYHFRRAEASPPLEPAGSARRHAITVMPTPLRFHGMPAPRFWALEDEAVSFGDLAAGPEDLVRAVVGAFAAVYADDWLVVPCVLPAGSIGRVRSLTVRDDYGQRHEISAAAALDGPDRVWRFFELEDDEGPNASEPNARRAPLMLLAPALPDVEEGPPLERVDLRRDQVANLAWAIERRALGASGRPVDRDALTARAGDDTTAELWSYRAFPAIPANWIPLIPVRLEDGATAEVSLRRGRMATPPPGLAPEALLPTGRLLEAGEPLRIREEAIPDAGLRLDRRYQRARGADGRVHLWIGRRVRTGAWAAHARFVTDRLLRPEPPSEG